MIRILCLCQVCNYFSIKTLTSKELPGDLWENISDKTMFCGMRRLVNTRTLGWGRRGIRGGGTQGRGRRERIDVDKEDHFKRMALGYDDIKLAVEKEFVKRELAVLNDGLIDKEVFENNTPSVRPVKMQPKVNSELQNSYKVQIKQLKSEISCQVVTAENQFEMVTKAVTLLHNLPYKDQLKMKKAKNMEVVEKLKRNKKVTQQISCSPRPTIPSPVLEKYRTKDQFSVMTDIQGRITVGFFVGNQREGIVCVEPSTINIIRDSHKDVARIYQNLLRKSAMAIHIYQNDGNNKTRSEKGYWGDIMVRSNYNGEIMVKIEFMRNKLTDNELEEAMKEIKDAFVSSDLPIVSLYIAVIKKKNDVKNFLLFGKKTLTEVIGGVSMHLGPDTFCQGNIAGTEAMIDIVRRKVNSSKNKTLIDLCCGAGLYSLHLAGEFRGCIGVDISDMSIANKNAEINGLENCSFIRGSVKSRISQIVEDIKIVGVGVSAVLNPGRAGVHDSVIQELRRIPLLDTVVYISCQPEDIQVYYNMVGLMREEGKGTPNNLVTKPFRLAEAIPVDLFPLTHHCEHIFVFRR